MAVLGSLVFIAPTGAAQTRASAQRAPVLCPVTGKPIDRTVVTRFRDRWVYFSSAAAKEEFEQDPFEYAEGLRAQWATNQPPRVQVKCPVSGEIPDPSIYVGQGEEAVYFATKDARRKWQQDSSPFKKRLERECYTYQTRCPHSEMAIDPAAFRAYRGQTIYFMCENCASAFDADEDKDKYLKYCRELIARNKAAWEQHEAKHGGRNAPTSRPATRGQSASEN